MRRRISDLPFVVEGRYLAVPSDAEVVKHEPVARFKDERWARAFIRFVNESNAEEAMVDRLHVRLKKVNKVIV